MFALQLSRNRLRYRNQPLIARPPVDIQREVAVGVAGDVCASSARPVCHRVYCSGGHFFETQLDCWTKKEGSRDEKGGFYFKEGRRVVKCRVLG